MRAVLSIDDMNAERRSSLLGTQDKQEADGSYTQFELQWRFRTFFLEPFRNKGTWLASRNPASIIQKPTLACKR